MKLKVWGEAKDEEKILTVRLREDSNGGITLISVNDRGCQEYAILTINPKGRLYRISSIFDDIGICVDQTGRIVLEDED